MRRLRIAAAAFATVVAIGTVGYRLLGFTLLDAAYQTVTTISTVGFREVEPLDGRGKVFTILLILMGVGTALYTFSVVFESIAEGRLRDARRRRQMDRSIAALRGHVVVCGWGRVGRAVAANASAQGKTVVVVDRDAHRLADVEHLHVIGDATDDAVLREAGVEHALALIAAIDTDAENLFVTLSGRAMQPELFIIARAREESSEAKLMRAGADRVVNPQSIGGARMAAFVAQPHVSEFLDVVMHEGQLEFRLEEVPVAAGSPFAGSTLRDAAIRERTGALVLALREQDGTWLTNPPADTVITPGQVFIAIGTQAQIEGLSAAG